MADPRPSRAAFRKWFLGSGLTQGDVAQALDIKQQTVSSLLRRAVPSRDLARLIEAGTGVAWGGWFTRREHDAWEKRLARARSLGAVAH